MMPSTTSWPDSLRFPPLSDSQIYVYRADLDEEWSRGQRLHTILSWDELERAGCFRFDSDRQRFIVARVLLRTLLSSYLGTRPADVMFAYGRNGKPYVEQRIGDRALYFNVTHSAETALFACSFGREVGIDVEQIQPDFPVQEVAERFFTPAENARIRTTPVEDQTELFFRYWTCKEAYIKGKGTGLSLSPDRFEISFTNDTPTIFIPAETGQVADRTWSLQQLDMEPGLVAALAFENHHDGIHPAVTVHPGP